MSNGHQFDEVIAECRNLPADWTSYNSARPTPWACDEAVRLVAFVREYGYGPNHVAPMADGGVGLWWTTGSGADVRTVHVPVENDCEDSSAALCCYAPGAAASYHDVKLGNLGAGVVEWLRDGKRPPGGGP